ncbi:Transglutaminase-like enzyme, putative cysteine protease [Marinobacter sp. es.042]|uniref:transglutaminase-like domain-containing protein n=1 Tax=Marinobacter sp. es.042 TaxID=1761794 RepID=UPI000B505370|nr:transglutaminase-like domain-containing protein [Marinobacter sp. es.042]SNB56928.1 Transglutaminase-like enzyme, putative cysteine protease [Marinobacter sp. es.042]
MGRLQTGSLDSKRGLSVAVVILLGCVAAVWALIEWDDRSGLAPAEPTASDVLVRYGFTLKNTTNQSLHNVSFSTFAPVPKTAFQTLQSIEASRPFTKHSDDLGNQTLSFEVPELPPYGQHVVTIKARLTMWSQPGIQFAAPSSESSDPLVEQGVDFVERILVELEASGTQLEGIEPALSIHQWVHQNLRDVGYVSRDRGARYALTERKGDCTEFMHAALGLFRASGLQALGIAGFRVNGRGAVLSAADYHNWTIFKGKGKPDHWHLSDPHGDVFNANESQYVAFRILKTGSSEITNSQRFFSYDPRVVVEMN